MPALPQFRVLLRCPIRCDESMVSIVIAVSAFNHDWMNAINKPSRRIRRSI